MANSRLEKVGTIFTRTTGLLRTGALKAEDKPIWYNVMRAFPPKLEPRFDRPTPSIPLQHIFYEEDKVRARFHKAIKQNQSVSLLSAHETETDMFVNIYKKLKTQGALCEHKIFETSMEIFQQQRSERDDSNEKDIESLSTRFSHAITQENSESKHEVGSINIKDVFKQ